VLDRSLSLVREGLAGRPGDDRPPMRWVGPATAWGRLQT
jgi:hypothetical protein